MEKGSVLLRCGHSATCGSSVGRRRLFCMCVVLLAALLLADSVVEAGVLRKRMQRRFPGDWRTIPEVQFDLTFQAIGSNATVTLHAVDLLDQNQSVELRIDNIAIAERGHKDMHIWQSLFGRVADTPRAHVEQDGEDKHENNESWPEQYDPLSDRCRIIVRPRIHEVNEIGRRQANEDNKVQRGAQEHATSSYGYESKEPTKTP